ncbi:hypothetical protein D4764_05G0011170 [Takifugu flavidus]|uniref:Reverse transcriptase domain-containing protein n=1 Tax=Takifugu flavidus TaxID=433684 RepID=A0A5C6N5T1_9TELE|nr:hypothetical protein D4764_05G0011170 [Takifugu flavidus]
MENDFWTASKRFWTTIRRLRKGEQCTEYFEDLFNPTNVTSSEEAGPGGLGTSSRISRAEVIKVVKKLLGGRVDEIRPEFLKALDVTGVVVPLFKKGDRRVCSNYRGITLLSLPGKVYSGVLERRVRRIVEPRIQDVQCGFLPGRGTVDQLHTLSRVFEGAWEFSQPVHMCFVDLEKTFDCVPRGVLWGVLQEYGMSGPLLRAVFSLYDRCQSLVRIAGRTEFLGAVMVLRGSGLVVKRELSQKAKLSIYRSIFVPTLTYGHELWVMTERRRSRVQAAEMSILRRVSGLSLRDRVRSSAIWEELGVEPLLLRVERSQMRWLGHLV